MAIQRYMENISESVNVTSVEFNVQGTILFAVKDVQNNSNWINYSYSILVDI